MTRLFVAIDLPTETRQLLAGSTRGLAGARWVPVQELHLTLRFIGEVDDAARHAIVGALSGVRFPRFPLTLSGVGHFPPGSHPRVLWVGIAPCVQLFRLQHEVEVAIAGAGAGVPADRRPFSPHLTLARLKDTPLGEVAEFEVRHRELVSPSFEIGEFGLYSSVLTGNGAIHNKVAAYAAREICAGAGEIVAT